MTFALKDISRYRSQLMGQAIVWIMMLHFTFTQIKPLGFIAQYGFAGVDIFMMMSGFGLYFSLIKENRILHFYKKRLLRIFPAYYLLGTFSSIFLFHDDFITYLYRYSTLGFWIDGVFAEWYIPSIVILYIFAPLIKKTIDNKPIALTFSICITLFFIAYCVVLFELLPVYDPHFFFLYRIPEFIFGMICAFWIKNKKSSRYFIYILIAGIPIFALLFPNHHEIYNYKYLALAFLLPTFTIILLYMSKIIHWLSPIFDKMGKASLEIYMIQGFFSTAIFWGKLTFPDYWHDLFTILFIILSSILGIITHWIIDKSRIHHVI